MPLQREITKLKVKQGASNNHVQSAAFVQAPVDQTNCLKQKGIVSVTPMRVHMLSSQRFARKGGMVESPC
jgi:hypothetical protein